VRGLFHDASLRLIRAFMRIDAALRRRIVMLVQEIADDDD